MLVERQFVGFKQLTLMRHKNYISVYGLSIALYGLSIALYGLCIAL